jgi:hypothetical protein
MEIRNVLILHNRHYAKSKKIFAVALIPSCPLAQRLYTGSGHEACWSGDRLAAAARDGLQ